VGYHCGKDGCSGCQKISAIHEILGETLLEYQNVKKHLKEILEEYLEGHIDTVNKWILEMELYDWQNECVDVWEKKGAGIVKVVTGAGKTILALEALSRVNNINQGGNIKNFIVVPTVALMQQWRDAILKKFRGIEEDKIGLYCGEEQGNYEQDLIQIYVVNSARKYLPCYNNDLRSRGFRTFLIADECHHYGSKENSKILTETEYDWTLGLSATPERESDWAFEEILVPHLGDIIYEYSYTDALKDGIIPPFTLVNYKISLTIKEKREYDTISEQISNLQKKLWALYPSLKNYNGRDFFRYLNTLQEEEGDENIEIYKALLNKRRMLVHDAENRYNALYNLIKKIFEENTSPRVLIFHEKIECADKIFQKLKEENYDVEIYHSRINKKEREFALYKYRHGFSNILITCKALDEGLDVPSTDIGIIVSSTKSVRQRIQRIGRVLRKAKNKNHSYIYTIYISGIDDDVFYKREIRELEGVSDVIWCSY